MKGSFQTISIVIFIALAVFGVLVFSGAIPLGKNNSPGSLGTVVLWGTVKSSTMSPLIEGFNNANTSFTVKYVEKSPDTLDQDLLEALADGKGPDMFFLPDNLAYHYSDKIFNIPYTTYPLANFKTTFAGAGEVFLTSRGVAAIPLAIDPLVMYYNRSIFDANGVVYPPAYWDELEKLVPTLNKKDDSNKIMKSAVALGDYTNIAHAKDILATLFLQAGNPIVAEKDGLFDSSLNSPTSKTNLSSVLQFYSNFADPNEGVYSWNKSFPNSNVAFSAENLAMYFGYASELSTLVNKNPNQNFLATAFPQVRGSNFKLTGARVLGIALLSSSKNFNTAFSAASLMASSDFALKFANALGVAPARRDLLALKPTDSYLPIFYNSALYSKSWLDPAPVATENIFRQMIEGVLSNNLSTQEAITDASSKLSLLLLK